MKLKVKVDKTNREKFTYSVYHGFGFPISKIPFVTKWMLDREGMSAEELGVYLSCYMDDECGIKFPMWSYHIFERNTKQ